MEKKEIASFSEARQVFKKDFLKFGGRATRSEFWWGLLCFFLLNIGLGILYGVIVTILAIISPALLVLPMIAFVIVAIILVLGAIASSFRRYRDVGLTGFTALMLYVAYAVVFVVTSDFYYVNSYSGMTLRFYNNNIFFIVLFIFLLVLYFLPTGLFAIKSDNKFFQLFLRKSQDSNKNIGS